MFNPRAWIAAALCWLFIGLVIACVSDPVRKVNLDANHVRPHADARLADGLYDCEDYAEAKRISLDKIGVKGKVWVVKRLGVDELHAVLVLDDGRVLDNLTDLIRTTKEAQQVGYAFLRPLHWIYPANTPLPGAL